MHEPCGGVDGPECRIGLTCVSTVLCTVGPCPGTCLEACDQAEACGAGTACEAPDGYADDERYCVEVD